MLDPPGGARVYGEGKPPRTRTRYTLATGDAMTFLDWLRLALAALLLGGAVLLGVALWVELQTRGKDHDIDN